MKLTFGLYQNCTCSFVICWPPLNLIAHFAALSLSHWLVCSVMWHAVRSCLHSYLCWREDRRSAVNPHAGHHADRLSYSSWTDSFLVSTQTGFKMLSVSVFFTAWHTVSVGFMLSHLFVDFCCIDACCCTDKYLFWNIFQHATFLRVIRKAGEIKKTKTLKKKKRCCQRARGPKTARETQIHSMRVCKASRPTCDSLEVISHLLYKCVCMVSFSHLISFDFGCNSYTEDVHTSLHHTHYWCKNRTGHRVMSQNLGQPMRMDDDSA